MNELKNNDAMNNVVVVKDTNNSNSYLWVKKLTEYMRVSKGYRYQFECDEEYVWYSVVIRRDDDYDNEFIIAEEVEDISNINREWCKNTIIYNKYIFKEGMDWYEDDCGNVGVYVVKHVIVPVDNDEEDEGWVTDTEVIKETFGYETEYNEDDDVYVPVFDDEDIQRAV